MSETINELKVWLNYDLGIRGDYENLFYFLDKHGAKSAGANLAVFTFKNEPEIIQNFTKELKNSVTFGPKDQIYLIVYRAGILNSGSLIGKPKRAEWDGYASTEIDTFPDFLPIENE